VLAAMIDKVCYPSSVLCINEPFSELQVGLIYRGNEMQIPL
jgi:hypothetical protein